MRSLFRKSAYSIQHSRFGYQIIVIIFLFITTLNLQGQFIIDSLEKKLPYSHDKERVEILNTLAKEYRFEFPDRCIQCGKEALGISQKLNYKKGIVDAQLYIAAGLHHSGNTSASFKYFNEATALAEEIGYKPGQAFGLRYIGNYYSMSNPDKAVEYYQKAIKLSEESGTKEGLDFLYSNMAEISLLKGNKEKALDYFKKCLKIREEKKDKIRILWSLRDIGKMYMEFGEGEKATEFLIKAFKKAKEFGDKRGYAGSMRFLGLLYLSWEQYDKALEFMNKALNTYQEIGPKYEVSTSYNDIGNIYLNMNQTDKAIENFKKTIPINIETGAKYKLGNVYMEMGAAYSKAGNYKTAIENLNQALKIFKETEDNNGQSWVYFLIGETYYNWKDNANSLIYTQKALELLQTMNHKMGIMKAHFNLARNYIEIGKYKLAIENIDLSFHYANEINFKHVENGYLFLSETYRKLGDYKKSNENLILYTNLKDSLFKEEQTKKVSELQLQFEMDKKENELTIKDLELSKEKNLRNFIIIAAILLLVIALGMISIYLTKKKTSKIFEEKNKQLENANEKLTQSEKELILLNTAKDNYLSILRSELNSAAKYVTSLLPTPIKEGDVSTDWMFVPSTQLGGDSFGYHWIDEDHFAIYLLDVCCHGIGPALLSVSILNVLRFHTLPGTDFRVPEQVFAGLNKTFQMRNHNGMFFTIWYGVYNRKTGELKYSTAGHPPALLVSDEIGAIELRVPNISIGGIREFEYSSGSYQLPKPSTLYIYSDGVYEIRRPDGTFWSMEEMSDYLINSIGKNGSEISALYKYTMELHGELNLEDDFSMLKVSFM
jgi:serine phosphatase RsbU (regulator of sigma subunit)